MHQHEPTRQAEDWATGTRAWNDFVEKNPILGFRPGRWGFHNFLRLHRRALIESDAIRRARNRFWIVHRDRFCAVAFELATGKTPATLGAPGQRSQESAA